MITSGVALGPSASAVTVGLAPTDGSPVSLEGSGVNNRDFSNWIKVSNTSTSAVEFVSASLSTADSSLEAFSVLRVLTGPTSIVVSPGDLVPAGAMIEAQVEQLSAHVGVHTGSLHVCDRAVASPTVGCSDWPVTTQTFAWYAPTITVHGPEAAPPGAMVTVTGTLADPATGAPIGNRNVSLARGDARGTATLPDAVTNAAGAFSYTGPIATTDTTFTASYDDADRLPGSASWTVAAVRLESALVISGPSTAVPASLITLAGTLSDKDGPIGGGDVAVSRNDASGTVTLPHATSAANGTFTVHDTVRTTNAFYSMTYPGDATHVAATATWTVTVAKTSTVLTVVAPLTAARGTSFTVSGSLANAGAAVPGAVIMLTRRSLLGSSVTRLVTSGSGSYAFRYTATVGGDHVFTAVWAGDATRASASTTKTVTVPRAATTLTLKSSRSVYAYGAKAKLTVHLGSTFNGRVVSVYARPWATSVTAPGNRLVKAKVNSRGNLVVTTTMTRRATYTAVFAGDYRYAPASRAVSPNVRTKVTLTMAGYLGRSGGAYLYRHGTKVYFKATVRPLRPYCCAAFTLQGYRSGRWVTVATEACGSLNAKSTAYMYITSSAPRGARYRIRGSVKANAYGTAGVSPWRYFRYT